MQRLVAAVLALAFVGLATVAWAAEDPTGTWKWTVQMRDQKREQTLKLELKEGKLTGAMIGRNQQETKIEDAKFQDGKISFKVTRERQGQKFTQKYTGTLKGDVIKGTIEFEREGKTQKREWEAKREKKAA